MTVRFRRSSAIATLLVLLAGLGLASSAHATKIVAAGPLPSPTLPGLGPSASPVPAQPSPATMASPQATQSPAASAGRPSPAAASLPGTGGTGGAANGASGAFGFGAPVSPPGDPPPSAGPDVPRSRVEAAALPDSVLAAQVGGVSLGILLVLLAVLGLWRIRLERLGQSLVVIRTARDPTVRQAVGAVLSAMAGEDESLVEGDDGSFELLLHSPAGEAQDRLRDARRRAQRHGFDFSYREPE